MAEAKYRSRAVNLAASIQQKAISRAKMVALKKTELMMKMTALKTSFADSLRNDELLQAQAAKVEAMRIQAEAKARARVAQEAAMLQTSASSDATLNYESAVASEGKLAKVLS